MILTSCTEVENSKGSLGLFFCSWHCHGRGITGAGVHSTAHPEALGESVQSFPCRETEALGVTEVELP